MKQLGKSALEILGILCGSAISAYGINQLLVPTHLLTGGFQGIAMILYHFFGWSVGTQFFLYNAPFLLLGWKHIGRKFCYYTVLSVASVSLFLNIIHPAALWTNNPLLAGIFGGIIASGGSAIVLRCGGSSGGLDLVARIVAKYKNVTLGKFNMLVNAIIISVSGFVFGAEAAMYTLISIFAGYKTYDVLLNHVGRATVVIITDKGEEISQAVTKALHRGVTQWHGQGAYTHGEKEILMSVVLNVQLAEFQQLVKSIDSKAFMTVIPTKNVIGNFNTAW